MRKPEQPNNPELQKNIEKIQAWLKEELKKIQDLREAAFAGPGPSSMIKESINTTLDEKARKVRTLAKSLIEDARSGKIDREVKKMLEQFGKDEPGNQGV